MLDMHKGGHNDERSQISERPPAPGAVRQPHGQGVERLFDALPFPFGQRVVVDDGGGRDTTLTAAVIGYFIGCGRVQVELGWTRNGEAKSAYFDLWRVTRSD